MVTPTKTTCDQCGASLLCEACGQFKWNQVHIIDNAVDPWYFCSKECHDKFLAKLKPKKKVAP